MNRIVVMDLGTGNLRSVARALQTAATEACDIRVSNEAVDIAQADRVVFPGQSAIGSVMEKLQEDPDLLEALREALETKPFLGICIGLQALYAHSSEDGGVRGLGVLDGHVQHFLEAWRDRSGAPFADPVTGRKLKIPHMGWNNLHQVRDHPLWQNIVQDAWFYFVHSYCPFSKATEEVYGTATYGLQFDAAAGRQNVFAVQFHPEKSQQNGLKLLSNFVNWDGSP